MQAKKVYFLISLLISFSLFAGIARAESEFSSRSEAVYVLDINGKAGVTQSITLTNGNSNVYATNYSLLFINNTPVNVIAKSAAKTLETSLVKIDEESFRLNIKLDSAVVGLGKSQVIFLSFTLEGLAVKNGQIWQVSLPKTEKQTADDSSKITLVVPREFGKTAYVFPPPDRTEVDAQNNQVILFENPYGENIVAAFGEFQVFDFDLAYHLKNQSDSHQIQQISLPPDTPYQRVFYSKITPIPENVVTDSEGNWLASYKLKPGESLDVKATGYTNVYATNQPFPQSITSPEGNLGESEFWQTPDAKIKSLAQKLSTPREIYKYIVDTLEYDYSRLDGNLSRLGAKQALESPDRAACQEFTDLFIAISRASGIPAREINGFGYSDNPRLRPLSLVSDILHAWPEYYDYSSRSWIQIDPTWADTTGGQNYFDKLDTNHITFAIHGQNPRFPRPVGDYKAGDADSKDVNIALGKPRETEAEKISVVFHLPPSLLPKIALTGSIVVTNASPFAIYALSLRTQSDDILIQTPSTEIQTIPPFGKIYLETKFSLKSLFSYSKPSFTLYVKNQEFDYSMPTAHFILSQSILPFTFILLVSIIYLIIKKLRHFTG